MIDYSYQAEAITDAVEFLKSAKPGQRRLYSSPTGSGKSYIALGVREATEAHIVTPRIEIAANMIEKLTGRNSCYDWSEQKLADTAAAFGIHTPVRLRNKLLSGDYPAPTRIIWDEAHHTTADTYREIMALAGGPPSIGLTATCYRGTPKESAELREYWGEPKHVLTIPRAASLGVITIPSTRVWPLLDDDEIKVVGGEIDVSSAGKKVLTKLDDLINRLQGEDLSVPTIVACPSTDSCINTARELERAFGITCHAVTQSTSRADRNRAFREAEEGKAWIVQINVVSEGVDLKLRRLIDLYPTLSPTLWMQRVGRITRPGGESMYICCCRNLERHCYLFEGTFPVSTYLEAQTAFGNPTKRGGFRAIGLENLGRFKPTELPLLGGVKGLMYNVSRVNGFHRVEYAILCHPLSPTPIYASREIVTDGHTYQNGKWKRIASLPDLEGFASVDTRPVTDKQIYWWQRSAKYFGLDPDTANLTRKQFAVLPILSDLGIRIKGY